MERKFNPQPKPIKEEKKKKFDFLKQKLAKKDESKVIPAATYRDTYLNGFRKKSKYKNVKQEYKGKKYDSKFEAKIAQDLDWQLESGELIKVERQVKIPLTVNGIFICNYYVDFKVTDKHGGVKYIEAKGLETDVFKIKKKLLLATLNEFDPGAEYLIVKC